MKLGPTQALKHRLDELEEPLKGPVAQARAVVSRVEEAHVRLDACERRLGVLTPGLARGVSAVSAGWAGWAPSLVRTRVLGGRCSPLLHAH
jgi:hypothetical protein